MKSVVSTIAVLFAVATLVACSKKEEVPTPSAPAASTAPAQPTPAADPAPAQPTPAAPVAPAVEPAKQEEKK